MAQQRRQRIGPFVVTTAANLDSQGITCAMCGKRLTDFEPQAQRHVPSPEQLLAFGAVAVPNFGWFCGQPCASEYEKEFGTRFQRDSTGDVRY